MIGEAGAYPAGFEVPSRERQMADVLRAENEMRRQVALGDRKGWTREQWIAEAEEIMNDPYGSVNMLLNGHVMALFEELHILREANSKRV